MKKAIFVAVTMLAVSGCSLSRLSATVDTYGDDLRELNKLDPIDGIDRSEAYTIAKAFFWLNISGCGFPDQPTSEANYWVSQTRIGIVGALGAPIFIDKATGTVTSGTKEESITLEELKAKSNKWIEATQTPQP